MTPVEAMKISLGRGADRLRRGVGDDLDGVDPRRCAGEGVGVAGIDDQRPRLARVLSWARHQSTGAEGHFDRVNTPATAAGRSKSAIITSVRPA